MYFIWFLLILGVFSYPKQVDTTGEYGGSSNSSVEGSGRLASASPHQNYGEQLIARSEDPGIDCDWMIPALEANYNSNKRSKMALIKKKCEKAKADRKRKNEAKRVNGEKRKPRKVKEENTFTEVLSPPDYYGDADTDKYGGSSRLRLPRLARPEQEKLPRWLKKLIGKEFRGYKMFNCHWNDVKIYDNDTILLYNRKKESLESVADRCPQKWSEYDKRNLLGGDKLSKRLYKEQRTLERDFVALECSWINRNERIVFFKKYLYTFAKYKEECSRYATEHQSSSTTEPTPVTETTEKPSPTTMTTEKPSPTTTTTEKPSPTTMTKEKPSPTTTLTEKPSPKATTSKEPSPKTTTPEETSPKTTTSKEPSTKTTTSKEPSPKTTTSKEPSPKTTTSDEPLPTTTTSKEPSPKITTSKEPSPKTTTSKEPSPKTTTSKEPSPKTTTSKEPSPKTTTSKEPSPKTTTSDEPLPTTTFKENISSLVIETEKSDKYNACCPGLSIHDIFDAEVINDFRINPSGNIYMPGSATYYYPNQVVHNYGVAKYNTKYYGLLGRFGNRQKYSGKKLPYLGGLARPPPKKNLWFG